jgi:hypothetical protein
MRHFGGILSLATETGAERGIVGERRLQQLNGDAAPEAGIGADADVCHAAAADEFTDLVSTGK